MTDVAVLGGGSWGTALAAHLAGLGRSTTLLFRRADLARSVHESRENAVYLPGFRLPAQVHVTADAAEALAGAPIVLVVTPVKGLDLAISWIRPHALAEAAIVSCAKGIRAASLETPTAVLARECPERAGRLAVLSGPTFARELVRRDPTAAVVAARDRDLARQVQACVAGGPFRLYTNDDPRGVELAGALKNVIALAAGVVEGLGYGANTTAALITRGLTEVSRLGVVLGGAPATFVGLAGMGDLVLTCTGQLSRNRTVGRELGRGRSLQEIVGGMKMVAEGVSTAEAARRLARQVDVEMPIVEQVTAVLFEGRRPADALRTLLARELKEEDQPGLSGPESGGDPV
jgi:glycerol-3-phosphate dehydrogenase (NAD(P)+)